MIGAMQVLAATFVGDLAARVFGLPVPGPALGMAVLLVVFAGSGWRNPGVERLFDALAPHFGVVFVPAAVGFVASLDVLGRVWLAAAVAIVLGTCLAIAAAGLAFQAMLQFSRGEATT
jgi:holin-like protein